MKCMRQQPGSWRNMDMNSMKFPIMPEKAGNAGIMWGIGPGRIIWDLDWGQPLFMEISVSPIPQTGTDIWKTVLIRNRSVMAMGMLQEKEDRIFLTRPGIHVSNQIMAEFLL